MAKLAEILGKVVGSDSLLPPDPLMLGGLPVPEVIVYPNTEAELAAVMACAHQHRWRVLPCGSGSKLAWGGVGSEVDLMVSTARLNQVIDHAVGDMTLTAEAGVKLADLAPQLAQHNQLLAVDPAYPDRATLGGIVATADTGALRQRYGGLRDLLIGISFVRYDGQLAKAGGRVVKNVAGYDLMKLMTGSYGTLGVISQLTFRLHPTQETSKTVVIVGEAQALAALISPLRQSSLTPVSLDVLSPALAAQLDLGEGFTLLARFQSITPGVDEQVDALLAMVGANLTAQVLEGMTDQHLWDGVGRGLYHSSAAQDQAQTQAILAKVGVPPAQALATIEHLPLGSWARLHISSGVGTIRLPAATVEAVQTLRSRCEAAGGYLTLLEAPLALKQSMEVWGYSGNALGVMKAIKAEFDPYNGLSPGRFVGGI
ncbi:FAD-binding oxidoreductase [Nodosilinea sp. E11]|uniref:FAD-binding oxidoreductase n=1 Tax=Nodosilinea sp. E11 TaxID=3037479 RepID=UPI0029342E84|nr:FAD-binding oxidoreductase [Nodosilinea sp. E11]WOD39067.1 FAD-binding oxidoreductase [Nodosilinea sp. E11]